MVTTSDILALMPDAQEADHDWLHQLLSDWQLLADLSFGDLALWVRVDDGWRAAAQVRPTTGVSVFPEDLIGSPPDDRWAAGIDAAAGGVLVDLGQLTVDEVAVSVDLRPVRRRDAVIAVMSRHLRHDTLRRRGRLESTYLGLADRLVSMVAEGAFPDGSRALGGRHGSPRVGDGVIALDAGGTVQYASPNAVSALRHLGVEAQVTGERLSVQLAHCRPEQGTSPEEAAAVLSGTAPWHAELRRGEAVVAIRAVPLWAAGRRTGAALLLRDTTELRRRDRELMTKDATIREIHHRVKNNLQTVAAVLRLQARRLDDEEARRALSDAGRRVAVIATVHESLSGGFGDAVDFDAVAAHGLATGIEVARRSDAAVNGRIEGSFGVLASEDATSLAMILGELVQNAVEHGLTDVGGEVVIRVDRHGDELTVEVCDDGVGMGPVSGRSPEPGSPSGGGLGSQIVSTFVHDLHGRIEWAAGEHGGTCARFTARLRALADH